MPNSNNIVSAWFDDQFSQLHPLLQMLHLEGGNLLGSVNICYGKGLAGIIGRRLAKKMDFPSEGSHQLEICISHDTEYLNWHRKFDDHATVTSQFKPIGNIHNGYWIESTGPLEMKLTIDILDGGWHWRCLSIRFLGISIPLCFIPQTIAYKTIEKGQYRFHVEFIMPILGRLVAYQGLLKSKRDLR